MFQTFKTINNNNFIITTGTVVTKFVTTVLNHIEHTQPPHHEVVRAMRIVRARCLKGEQCLALRYDKMQEWGISTVPLEAVKKEVSF